MKSEDPPEGGVHGKGEACVVKRVCMVKGCVHGKEGGTW